MSAVSGNSEDSPHKASDRTRKIVREKLTGSGLHIRELTYELIITNPQDADKGQIHVACDDGLVSWERVEWDYWARFEGCGDGTDAEVPAAKIIEILTSPDVMPHP